MNHMKLSSVLSFSATANRIGTGSDSLAPLAGRSDTAECDWQALAHVAQGAQNGNEPVTLGGARL